MIRGFRSACARGDTEMVRAFLKGGDIDPSDNENLAIRIASERGNVGVVRALLEDRRTDPTVCNYACVHWATIFGYYQVVRILLDDNRVDTEAAVSRLLYPCARQLATDPKYGVRPRREMYQKFHPSILAEYDAMIAQCYSMGFVAKQLPPWESLVEPVVERMGAGRFSVSK
jgi:hypothetical protein